MVRWTRILKYVAALFAATFAVGFVFGLLEDLVGGATGAQTADGLGLVLLLAQALAMFAVMALILGAMAYRATGRATAQAHLVAATVWLLSLPSSVVLPGQTTETWLIQGAFVEVCAIFGLGAGLGTRALVGLLADPANELATGPAPEPAATDALGGRG